MLFAFMVSCAEKKAQENIVSVIPQPMCVRIDEGTFSIDKNTKIFVDYPTEEVLRTVGFLNEKFAKAAGFELEVIAGGTMPREDFIAFMDAGMQPEHYLINVHPNSVFIEYGDGAGAFYGLQTLFQILPIEIYSQDCQKGIKWNVPCCYIEDLLNRWLLS